MEAEHLSELEAQIAAAGSSIVIEMQEVMLLDIDAVRFLARREKQGIALRGCSPYIREWINREGQDEI